MIGFSVDSHEIIDIFNTQNVITAIDSITFENKAPMFAYGSEKGDIIIREDWSDSPQSFQLNSFSRINDIKFSINGHALIAITECGEVHKLTLHLNSYFDTPKKIKLNSRIGTPLSINFTNDKKHIIVTMDTREHYKIELQEFKQETTIDDSSFNISL